MLDPKQRNQDLNWTLSFLCKAKAHATAEDAAMLVAGGAVTLALCFLVPWPVILVAGPMLVVGAMLTAGAIVKGWRRWRRRRRLDLAQERLKRTTSKQPQAEVAKC